MTTFALGIKKDCHTPLTGRDTLCHLAAEMSRPVTTPRDTFLKILQSNFGAVTGVTTSRPFKFLLKYVGKPTSQRTNRLGRDSVTAVTPVNVKENRAIDLYATMTYNIWHEEITCGHNCSIDGGSESPAPSNVRGNGYIANRGFGACDPANGKDAERGKVMNITYYPNGKSKEGFEVGHIVNNMRYRWYTHNGRLRTTIRPAESVCAHCGAESGWRKGHALQAHHIKPVWAWMLDQVLRQPPSDRKQGEEMALRAQWGLMELDTHFHTPDKLVHLCKHCHEKEEVKALAKWKAHYNKHPKISIR